MMIGGDNKVPTSEATDSSCGLPVGFIFRPPHALHVRSARALARSASLARAAPSRHPLLDIHSAWGSPSGRAYAADDPRRRST